VILWDLTDRTRPTRLGQPLTGHTRLVDSVAFAPDGRTLATASADTTVILWDLTDRARPTRLGQPLIGDTGPVNSVAFAPDGRTLAAGDDRTAILWDLTVLNDVRAHVVERACAIAGRGLNPDEWARYLPDATYQDTCKTAN
jgi:WD40 repeat protein